MVPPYPGQAFMPIPAATICIIDDDASLRAAIIRVCRSAGLEAIGFASADDFLAAPVPTGRGATWFTEYIIPNSLKPKALPGRKPG